MAEFNRGEIVKIVTPQLDGAIGEIVDDYFNATGQFHYVVEIAGNRSSFDSTQLRHIASTNQSASTNQKVGK